MATFKRYQSFSNAVADLALVPPEQLVHFGFLRPELDLAAATEYPVLGPEKVVDVGPALRVIVLVPLLECVI